MKDLTKGSIYKTFLIFAIPMVLSGMLSQCYSVVNTIVAGQLLGEDALGAIGAVAPLDTFINSVFWGYGVGMGVYVAHLFGAKEYYRIKCVTINNFRMLSIIIVLVSVLMIVFRGYVFNFLNVAPEILKDCEKYFVISMAGKVFVLFAINALQVVVATGDSAFPLYMSMLSTVLNIGIGASSIIFFDRGVSGLALGNVLSSIIVGTLYILKITRTFKKMDVLGMKIKSPFESLKTTFRYSILSSLQQASMYFAGIVLSPMVNNISASAAASYIVTYRIYDINAAVYQNSSKTVATYTAQCFGARKYEQIKKGMKVGYLQSMLFAMPFLLVSIFMAKTVSGLFFGADASPEAISYTLTFLRYGLPFILVNIVANLYHNYFRGIGYMSALFATAVSGSIARIIASLILIPFFGIYGYYAGWVISWFADAALSGGFYLFSKRCKEIRKAE